MEYVIGLLFFAAGIAGGLAYGNSKFKKWKILLNGRIKELLNARSGDTVKDSGRNGLPPDIKEVLNIIQSSNSRAVIQADITVAETVTEELPSNYRKIIDNLHIVNELGQRVTSSLNLEKTFQHLYGTINSMMDAAVLELRVYGGESESEWLFTNLDAGNNSDGQYKNHMADWSHKNNREVFLSDAANDYDRYVYEPLTLPDGRIAQSVMVFPLLNGDVVTGTLCVISFRQKSFTDYHSEIISQLLGYVSVAIENAMRHEELNLTKIRAEKSEKFKEQFLANMSHEIRTPINAVTGMTRLLMDKNPRPDQLKYLDSIKNASESLLGIINEILDLSKLEAGKVELEHIEFSVNDVVNSVKEITGFKAEEKGLSIHTSIDEKCSRVYVGDPARLHQVLLNLVGNAVKFTDKGQVDIKVEVLDNSGEASQQLLFSIHDTGIGMTESEQQNLFQNYAQAGTDTSRKYGGTGLGLSISKQLVQLLGGSIKVVSMPGKGSTFSFLLRFEVSKNTTVHAKESSVSETMLKKLKGIRILVADDNEYNRIVTKETIELKVPGIVIDEALDGAAAFEMIAANTYQVVLMDVVMPVMDGLEATRKVRKELPEPKNKTTIIALTASVVKSEVDKCFDAGMDGFIPKPFKSNELFTAIYESIFGATVRVSNVSSADKIRSADTLINLDTLKEYAEGDPVRLKRLTELFISKTPVALAGLKEALAANDFERMRILAHSIKPQLQSAGVSAGLEIAATIESQCLQKPDAETLAVLIAELGDIVQQAVEELKAGQVL